MITLLIFKSVMSVGRQSISNGLFPFDTVHIAFGMRRSFNSNVGLRSNHSHFDCIQARCDVIILSYSYSRLSWVGFYFVCLKEEVVLIQQGC